MAIEIDTSEVDHMISRLRVLRETLVRPGALLGELGEKVVTQTKERIDHEKKAPDGETWRPWSAPYAATRGPEHSLLIDSRDLHNSIAHVESGSESIVFSPLEYAAVHQFGFNSIPARPYLGLSAENATELEAFLGAELLATLRGGL